MQGTFLKESIGKELEAMSSHVALNQASDKVLHLQRPVLSTFLYHLCGHCSCTGPEQVRAYSFMV